ncbi:hypothetical protein SAMN04488128_105437 [Chitinophaga eiseniae]|uniref:Uncharacterized protein n=1 Tax=Chitinophaga eiseniae TaxID=634771 RepID=A0A1T4TM71_9BACT|nr:hypothetical protein [Chitinophaga eiseniae]SKA41418.1 hypothetical protein SAMN04488128_105437 [Chitinophaga eiseniae]
MVNLPTIYLQATLRHTFCTYAIGPGWAKTDMGTAAAFPEIAEGANIIVKTALE